MDIYFSSTYLPQNIINTFQIRGIVDNLIITPILMIDCFLNHSEKQLQWCTSFWTQNDLPFSRSSVSWEVSHYDEDPYHLSLSSVLPQSHHLLRLCQWRRHCKWRRRMWEWMPVCPWEWTLWHPVPTETQRKGVESRIGWFCAGGVAFCVFAEGTEMKHYPLRAWCNLQTVAVARQRQKKSLFSSINYALL